ncbi:2-isopropylmalate synthase [Candidatus Micrarchaeota archaeon]|nr:2-isopropylmalate synthase [Candidatus Micrarchaeota archaeon]
MSSEKIFVSEFNKEAGKKLKMPARVTVFDSTLRDGEQLAGVSFKTEEKLEIAMALDKLGVDIIEAGFPVNSQPEFDAVEKIANEKLKAKVCGLARVLTPDIDACLNAGVDIVHVFVSTSDIHLKYQMGKTREEVLKMAVDAVKYVKKNGRECIFSPMDATRTPLEYLLKVCKEVEKAGADRINVPDTVGVMNPSATRMLFGKVREAVKVPIQTHAHNDFGLAVANTLAGVEAGATDVQVTVNGLGERAGNASLEQVVMSLHALYGVRTNIKTELLSETSRLLERYSEVYLPPNYPLVGKAAFAHESGIHAHAVLKAGQTFEPIAPELVGQKRRIVVGKHSGKASIENALKALGYEKIEQTLLIEATKKIKELAEVKKQIYDEDIIAISEDVIGQAAKTKPLVTLEEVTVVTGNKITPAASIVLKYGDEILKGAGQGVGPVDAAANAIQTILGSTVRIKLTEYNLRAITGGTDALADVTIKVMDEQKNVFAANAVNDDIVMASVQALLRAINDAINYQKRTKEKRK